MSRRRRGLLRLPQQWDPRRPPSWSEDDNVLDAESAILVDHVEAARTTSKTKDGRPVFYLELTGRVNLTAERAALGFLLTPDGVANAVHRLLDVAHASPEVREELMNRLTEGEPPG